MAVTPTTTNESIFEHVKRLLDKVIELRIKIKLLFLDGGYYNIDVINLLNALRIKFIIKAHDIVKLKARDNIIYTTASHRHLANQQATFRAAAFNGRNKAEKIALFVFATNTYMKARKIRCSGRGGS